MTRLFHDFLVRWVQQFHWPSSSLTDVKDSFTQAVLPKSFLFYLPLLKDWKKSPTEKVYRVQCLARASVKQFRSLQSPVLKKGHKCMCQPVTLVRRQVSLQFSSWPKIRSMKSVSFAMLKAEKAWVWQTHQTLWQEESWLLMLPCDDPLWLRFRFVARMSTACCIATISQQKYDVVQSFRSLLSFKRHFCYKRMNGSCWVQIGSCSGLLAVAAPRIVSNIFVTSREWWYILNEIKEAYRMERYFSDHLACRLYRHSIAKPSASWDLFARILPGKASWGSIHAGWSLSRLRMVFWIGPGFFQPHAFFFNLMSFFQPQGFCLYFNLVFFFFFNLTCLFLDLTFPHMSFFQPHISSFQPHMSSFQPCMCLCQPLMCPFHLL